VPATKRLRAARGPALIAAYPAKILPSKVLGLFCAAQSCCKTRHSASAAWIEGPPICLRIRLGSVDALNGTPSRTRVRPRCGRLDNSHQSEDPETAIQARNGMDDQRMHYRHVFSNFLVVIDVARGSVTLCRAYRRIRRSTPVVRNLEAKEAVLWGISA
jgi:hypothetical protein